MTDTSKRVPAFYVDTSPGDATRYKFLIVKHDSMFFVQETKGLFTGEFAPNDIEAVQLNAPEVIAASYNEYQPAACSNQWLGERFFPWAKENHPSANPWTVLAAIVTISRNKGEFDANED